MGSGVRGPRLGFLVEDWLCNFTRRDTRHGPERDHAKDFYQKLIGDTSKQRHQR